MKLHRLITAAVGGLLLAGASMASAGTIVFSSLFNGSGTTTPSGGYMTIANGLPFDSGQWTVTNGVIFVGNIDIINGNYSPLPFPPSSDPTAQAVDLDGTTNDGSNPQGGITSEAIATNVGDFYTLTFYLSGNSGGGTVSDAPQFNTLVTIEQGTSSSTFEPSEDKTWTKETINFQADNSGSVNLEFQSVTPDGFSGPTLADVTLTDDGLSLTNPAPSPASAAGGAALLAGMFVAKMRGRKNAV